MVVVKINVNNNNNNNTQEFVAKIKDISLRENETITSYDVSALFTSVPADDACKVVRERLLEDTSWKERTPLDVDEVCQLLKLCLDTTYFSFKNTFYLQKHGCAMGSPVSPIVVNLYMEFFEKKVIDTFQDPPRLWLRYVDDTFVILKKSAADTFFGHINNVDSNIKFTQEPIKDNCLPFLDCRVTVKNDQTLKTTVYRKPTHTDHYLQFDSNHPLVHKVGVIQSLFHRANTIISDTEEKDQEIAHIKSALGDCGYPDWAYQKVTNSQRHKQTIRSATNTCTVNKTIPYVKGLSECIKSDLAKFRISVSFKPFNKIRGKLVHLKDKKPKDKQSHLVYGIKCSEPGCDESYVGETQQALKARLKQHRRPSSSGEAAFNSAVFNHIATTGHTIEDKDVKILDREENWWQRGVKEAIVERVEQPSLNRNGGLRHKLSHTWDRALQKTRKQLTTPRVSIDVDRNTNLSY